MKSRLTALLVAQLFAAAPPAFAADGGLTWSGSVGLGLRHTNDKAQDPSKLNEYRDLDSGVIGIFDVRARSDTYYLNAFGENIGRDDMYLDLWGGQYGTFKYQLYGNWLRHNFGSGVGALSPYSGIGSATLTSAFPRLNTATWNTFDNSYDRRDIGGMFEISKDSPWYFRVEGNEVNRSGIRNISGAQGTSPGNGFVELPTPVDFKTRNVSAEGGYQTKQKQFAVSAMYSKFANDNLLLRWSNGFMAPAVPTNYDTTVLAPENEFWKVAANGVWRQLPLESTLAGRLTYGKLTNEVPVLPTMLAPGAGATANTGIFPSTASSSPLFEGELVTKTAALSLTSRPYQGLDTRLYWNWSRKDNNSTALTFNPTAASTLQCSGGPCTPELFNYRKQNLGVEAGYRVNPQNKLSGGFDYWDMKRERIDFVRNLDAKYYLEWKSSSLDMLDARIKYQYLERRSTFKSSDPSNPIDLYVRRFDLANVDQNQVKLVLDSSPVPFLDLGFEGIFKKNDYRDTILGRTDDERKEFYVSASYGDPKSFRVMIFGDIEFVEFNSVHRVGTGDPNPAAAPAPLPPATASTYNWAAKNKDKSWQVGLGTDWVPAERWKLNASLIYAQTDGSVDFSALPSGGVTPVVDARNFLRIGSVDNTRRTALNLKGTYKFDRQWEFTGGYAYERYRYSDIGYDGFRYTVAGATAAQTSYLTGQSAFQNYTANIFYVIGTYKF